MAESEGAEVNLPVEAASPDAIEIVIDKPGETAAAAAKPPEPVIAQAAAEPQKVVTGDDGIEGLKEQVARAKAESERRLGESQRKIQEAYENARRAEERAAHAEKEVATVKQGAVLTVLDNLKRDKEDAKRKYRAAMEAGEFDKAADAQDELSLANARIVEAEKGKQELEERAKAPPVAPRRTEPLPADDPAERLAATLSPRSAAWVRSHPEFARDEAKQEEMTRAHFSALGEGHRADTEAYFDFVNRKLGITKAPPDPVSPGGIASGAREASRAPASAPVSRDVTQSPGSARPNTVHLTASEVATAKAMDMKLEDYARYKVALIKEGKIGRVAS